MSTAIITPRKQPKQRIKKGPQDVTSTASTAKENPSNFTPKEKKITSHTEIKVRKVLGELSANEVKARSAPFEQPENRLEEEHSEGQDESPRRSGERSLPVVSSVLPSRRIVRGSISRPSNDIEANDAENVTPVTTRTTVVRRRSQRIASAESAAASSAEVEATVPISRARSTMRQRRTPLLARREDTSARHVTASS